MSTSLGILCFAARAISRNIAPALRSQNRDLVLMAHLCRKRRRTNPRSEECHCEEPIRYPLCRKRQNCMNPWQKPDPKCPPLPLCKDNICEKVDPRAWHDEQEAGKDIERAQRFQAREERRVRKCLELRRRYCPKKRKRRHNVYKSNCPKDYSDRRR